MKHLLRTNFTCNKIWEINRDMNIEEDKLNNLWTKALYKSLSAAEIHFRHCDKSVYHDIQLLIYYVENQISPSPSCGSANMEERVRAGELAHVIHITFLGGSQRRCILSSLHYPPNRRSPHYVCRLFKSLYAFRSGLSCGKGFCSLESRSLKFPWVCSQLHSSLNPDNWQQWC